METKKLLHIANKKLDLFTLEEWKKLGILPTEDMHHFPVIAYPVKPQLGDETVIFKNICPKDITPFALYIHIPFCTKLCTFCQFDTCLYTSSNDIDIYLDYLEKEILLWEKKFPSMKFTPRSGFIGGGTPTLLNPTQWDKLFTIIKKHFDLRHCRQFSIDVEPRTICGKQGVEKLKIMKKHGITRLCLGAQSFDDPVLKKMKRPHNAKDIFEATRLIKKVGFDTLILDLIFGYPETTPEMWIKNVQNAIKLNVDGYQTYQLRILSYRPKELKKVSIRKKYQESPESFLSLREVHLLKMLTQIISKRNNYKQFGRGVFLKHARHNSEYLKNIYCMGYKAIGVGKGAVSFLKQKIFLNVSKGLKNYYKLIDKEIFPINSVRLISDKDFLRTCVLMPLKNCGTVDKKRYKKMTGTYLNDNFKKTITMLKTFGFLKEDANSISFTKKGLFFDDDLLFHFFDPCEIPLPQSAYSEGKLNPFIYD